VKLSLAELLGTFALVFAGTGAIVIIDISGGTIGHIGIAATFGLVVMAMIQTFGDVSGAQFNPAVSLAFAVAGKLTWARLPGYVVAQCVGALLASGLLRFLFPTHELLGSTLPSGAVSQSFVLEAVLTAMLMLTILSMTTCDRRRCFSKLSNAAAPIYASKA
jgi:aquaporin Z